MQPLSENALDAMVAEERDHASPPLTDWSSLSAQLKAEGLIRERSSRITWSPLMRIAAGLVLVAGGAIGGRLTADAGPGAPVAAADGSETPAASLASDNRAPGTVMEFSSPDEAWEVLNRAGEEYQRASAYLSSTNNEVPMPMGPSQYRTRLAALDNVMSEMRSALKEVPQDPVINQYYLATVGAREATLRQMGTTLPASARLNRF